MGKQIKATLAWTILLFVLLTTFNCIIQLDIWLLNAISCAIIAGVGFYFGYEKAKEDLTR